MYDSSNLEGFAAVQIAWRENGGRGWLEKRMGVDCFCKEADR